MTSPKRVSIPALFIAAALALLVFAATAAAETKSGEATSPVNEAIPGEADILSASANYDSTAGTVDLSIVTRAAPGSEEEEPGFTLLGGVVTVPGPCSTTQTNIEMSAPPSLAITSPYESALAESQWQESAEEEFGPEHLGPASKTLVGTTTTLSATTPKAVGKPYNCAVAATIDFVHGFEPLDLVIFPIAPPAVEPTKQPTSQTTAPAPPAPAPAPGVLSIAKSKPLELKSGKWKTVRIKVSNSGGSATAQGSLRLKAPRGVLVKPERQKLPVLTPGGSWTLTAKVQLTEKAKAKSTLAMTAAAASLTAKGSLVVKLAD